MNDSTQLAADAFYWLLDHQHEQPSLQNLADAIGRSPAHLQKTFKNAVGVSPKQLLRFLTRDQALARLRAGETVLEAALASGLSGPGRLHDLLLQTDAITPGEARRLGRGLTLQYGTGVSPFGPALIAWSPRGITFLAFYAKHDLESVENQLRAQWPDATLLADPEAAKSQLGRVFDPAREQPLPLWLRGSPFQLKVWEALLSIPAGQHVSYGALARYLGKASAGRAVGSAVGRNPIAWLIPCHRVITTSGALGGYRWGLERKQLMIALESAAAPLTE